MVHENERLAALARYAVLDTTAEDAFDELVQLASSICATPIALISLVDATRQWFKARVGLEAPETPRQISFCTHAIRQNDLFVVHDAQADPLFAENPLVTGDPHIRFYAGAPLITPDGFNLGTLCVIDREPRVLDPAQQQALVALARQVVVQLELRRQIAEKAIAEERLARVAHELDRFFDVSLDLLCIAGMDGYFRRLNPAFEDVLGYTRDELCALPFIELVHPDDRAVTITETAKLQEGRTTVYFENRYLRKDGTTRWIAWTASPATEEGLIYAAGRDITRAKIAEHELRRSEGRTRSIIDNAPGGLIATDTRGIIESANPAAERIFGYAATEIIGGRLDLLIGSNFDLHAARDRVIEVQARRRNGETFTCEVSVFEFYAADDQRHFAANLLDVSERHVVERMKRDFISTVSHELRTPLTSIRGSLGLLASGVMGEMPPDAKPVISVAERNSVRLISLINDILDFDRLESGKMRMQFRPTPLLRVLERSVESISAVALQDGVHIELQCNGAVVLGDEERLMQVTVNLLSNAVKYSNRGDTVVVSDSAEAPSMVEVRVADRGRGIPADLQKKLFRRFERADSSDARTKPGTGLGLAICKAIVEQHGGAIGVASGEGMGSTFWFRVPAVGVAVPE
ncbi:MAG TPA: PAS domain S-box protein [Thermoanaerobaculia bacterium]|nr:PAS domain S-box protein [Thermoanaerobaculia bacterium]